MSPGQRAQFQLALDKAAAKKAAAASAAACAQPSKIIATIQRKPKAAPVANASVTDKPVPNAAPAKSVRDKKPGTARSAAHRARNLEATREAERERKRAARAKKA